MEPLRTLRQCLIDTELAHLRVIARLWGLELKASQPLEIAAELAMSLADPAHADHVWQALPDDQRAALAALLAAGGMMPAAIFRRRFGEIRPMGPGRLERETPWRDPIGPAEGLWYRGLIYQGFAEKEGETYPIYFVPAELRAALPAGAERATTTIQLKPAAPPAQSLVAGDLLLDNVTTALAFVHNETVRPGAAPHAWPESARQALAHQLRDRDPERLAFILHLLAHLGWTRPGDDGRLRLTAEPVTAWLKETPDEGRATLVRAWREMTDWNELWRLPSLQPDNTGTWRNDPALARAALLRHLEALTPGEWVRLDDFVNAVKVADPDFQRPGGDYEAWYIRGAANGAYLTGFESWDQVEGALLRALLNGPAWWLDLAELGGGVFRLRATQQGWVATLAPPAAVVRPDLTVTMPAARRFERFQLARVADLSVLDDPYVYRLTPAALSRARRQGITVEKALTFLDELSDAPLPQAVRSSLTRWGERGTEVWLERTLLLRVADAALLQQLITAPQTSRYVGRVVGPTVAVVTEKDWPKLVATLAEMGLLAELVGVRDA